MTICKKCGTDKPNSDFYRSKNTASGINGKCKVCYLQDCKRNRSLNADRVKAYDKARANRPDRIAMRTAYSKTDAYKQSHDKANLKYRKQHPKRYTARNILNAAVRDRKIVPLPCFVCGKKAEAHHPDYDRPLDVIWLCAQHHNQVHLGEN